MAAVMVRTTPVDQLVRHAGYSAAFTRGDMLGFLETEATQITNGAALATFVFGQPCLACILHHREVAFAGDCHDWVHLARHSENMHRHDRPSAFGNLILNC